MQIDQILFAYAGGPGRIRTYDLELRSLLLYPTELPGPGAGGENRTRVHSWKNCYTSHYTTPALPVTVYQTGVIMDAQTQQLLSSDTFQILLYLSLATLPLKGLAMWKASQRKRVGWYIVLLVTNTLGILDTIYYFFVDLPDKKKPHKTK